MKKNLKEMGFISVLIFIVAVGIYWMIYGFKKDSLDHYINLLGDRLLAMVPKENDKKDIGVLFDEFKQKVKEKKVNPKQIEAVTADILNMSNREDTLSVEEAECLLAFAVVNPIELNEGEVVEAEPAPSEILEISVDHDVERWNKLNKRLQTVYDFNLNLHQKMKKIPRLKNKIRIHIGNDLNVFLDKNIQEILDDDMDIALHKELVDLQKEHIIVWSESLETKLEGELERLSDELDRILEKNEMNINRIGEIKGIDLNGLADSVALIKEYICDSLQVKIEDFQVEDE